MIVSCSMSFLKLFRLPQADSFFFKNLLKKSSSSVLLPSFLSSGASLSRLVPAFSPLLKFVSPFFFTYDVHAPRFFVRMFARSSLSFSLLIFGTIVPHGTQTRIPAPSSSFHFFVALFLTATPFCPVWLRAFFCDQQDFRRMYRT